MFNNLRLVLGTNLNFYTSLSKGLELKVKMFWELILVFIDVTGEKLIWGSFCSPHIQNRVKNNRW